MKTAEQWLAFRLACQFLTVLPTGRIPGFSRADQVRSVLYYPLTGLLIGLLLVTAGVLLDKADTTLAAALLLVLWVAVTGGLHLDGLADCADALVAGARHISPQKRLQIMKDPHVGAMAVISLCLLLLVKFTALQQLLETGNMFLLIMVPVMARTAVLWQLVHIPYISPEGLMADIIQQLPRGSINALVLAGVVLGGFCFGLVSMLVCVMVVYALGKLSTHQFQGANGDVYGATIEITETLLLVLPVILAGGSE